MIGVIAKNSERLIAEEFFQLFKVPWEFYQREREYDVVIVTDNQAEIPSAKLVIVFSSKPTTFDRDEGIKTTPRIGGAQLKQSEFSFPIYRGVALIQSNHYPCMIVKDSGECVGVKKIEESHRILRIGYDLFDEIGFLLCEGQPVRSAQIPTVEIHISVLRNWILKAGVPLVEIPPQPRGYDFTVCLTHDIDFIGIKDHKFDRSLFGFLWRAMLPFFCWHFWSKEWRTKLIRNWKALITLPGVYLGLSSDLWFDVLRYMAIEKGMVSTFFFIPFKNHAGIGKDKAFAKYRAVHYDVRDYKSLIQDLLKEGAEIGLHGIDAWYDSKKGSEELEIIRTITSQSLVGVRMHWLFFSGWSHRAIGESGFYYDSTLGYNRTVGYRSGTTQVYGFLGGEKTLELPLNIIDTAMFSPKRMGLSESKALELCKTLIKDFKTFGGVLTVNWHIRSLSPERNWDIFYLKLLEILKREKVWFASGRQVVTWFNKRRSIHFDKVSFSQGKVRLRLSGLNDSSVPDIFFRIHLPGSPFKPDGNAQGTEKTFVDLPWLGEEEVEICV
jgi:hypothetical protein